MHHQVPYEVQISKESKVVRNLVALHVRKPRVLHDMALPTWQQHPFCSALIHQVILPHIHDTSLTAIFISNILRPLIYFDLINFIETLLFPLHTFQASFRKAAFNSSILRIPMQLMHYVRNMLKIGFIIYVDYV